VKVLLALPQNVHDWTLKDFATACKGEERRGSLRTIVCIEGYLPDQLFDVE